MARRAPKSVPDVLAAVDLGSNSFHMVVARYTHGQLVILDRPNPLGGNRIEGPGLDPAFTSFISSTPRTHETNGFTNT